MENALIVSDPKYHNTLAALLTKCGYGVVRSAQNTGEARRQISTIAFDLITINTPLTDEFGGEFALTCANSSDAGVILLVAGAQADKIAADVEKMGIFVLNKPVSPLAFLQAVKMIRTSRYRILELQKKNRQLLQKLDDTRFICRAKCALISYRGMTENEAHHYIEHLAMDRRVSRKDIALDILKTFEGY